jgi:hypothetical protein
MDRYGQTAGRDEFRQREQVAHKRAKYVITAITAGYLLYALANIFGLMQTGTPYLYAAAAAGFFFGVKWVRLMIGVWSVYLSIFIGSALFILAFNLYPTEHDIERISVTERIFDGSLTLFYLFVAYTVFYNKNVKDFMSSKKPVVSTEMIKDGFKVEK